MSKEKGLSTEQVGRYYIEFIEKLIDDDGKRISKISELKNGIYLSEILSTVKDLQMDILPYQDQMVFVNCFANLKYLLSQIEKYWIQELKLSWEVQIQLVNAAKGNQQEIIKLVRIIIRTLFISPSKDQFIQKILETSQQTQQFFMQLINTQNIEESSKKIDDNKYDLLYRRLEEVERQNEKLVKIIEEMQHESLLFKQREREYQERAKQSEKQILLLNQEVKVLRINAYQNHQQQLQKESSQQSYNNSQQNNQQFKQKEQKMLLQIQELRQLTQNQEKQLKSLSSYRSQLQDLKIEYNEIVITNQQLSQKLNKTMEKLQSVINQLKFSQQTIKQNTQQIQTLRESMLTYEKTIIQKNQHIEQLENNIKYLLQTQSRTSTPKKAQSNSLKTTLKEQCQSTMYTNRQQLLFTKIAQENLILNRQLKLTQQNNQKLQKQLQKINHVKDQNIKLVQMINHMHKYRGQENQLLLKTLYQMRLRLLKNQITPKNTMQNQTLKDINRVY